MELPSEEHTSTQWGSSHAIFWSDSNRHLAISFNITQCSPQAGVPIAASPVFSSEGGPKVSMQTPPILRPWIRNRLLRHDVFLYRKRKCPKQSSKPACSSQAGPTARQFQERLLGASAQRRGRAVERKGKVLSACFQRAFSCSGQGQQPLNSICPRSLSPGADRRSRSAHRACAHTSARSNQ